MLPSRRVTNPFPSAIGFALSIFVATPVFAQIYSTGITSKYRMTTNVTYLKEGAWEGKLDIYYRTDPGPHPTLIFIGGGGAMDFKREDFTLQLIPYLEWGWNVVNLGNRLPGVTLAPEAINNCFCALRWIIRNAKQFGFDTGKLIISGTSSGGWWALATAMIPRSQGWDELCPGDEDVKIAAVVNWYGVSDLGDLLQNSNYARRYTAWIRNLPNPMEIAKAVSPINFVRPGVPPVISIHGDADPVVPYTQSVRLHEALKRAGVAEELITIPGGDHGGNNFTRVDNERAYAAIRAFLAKTGALIATK